MTSPRPRPTRVINRVVVGVLRSPFHRALSGALIEIRYRGRKSGRWYSLPAQYAVDEGLPDVLVVYPGHPDRKVWWRSFLEDAGAIVVLRRAELSVTGSVVDSGHPRHAWAVETYTRRFRKVQIPNTAPLVLFTRRA